MTRKFANFYASRLKQEAGSTDTRLVLDQVPRDENNNPITEGVLVLEARRPDKREIVMYTGVEDTTVTGVVRGVGGTQATSHARNAVVEMTVTGTDLSNIYEMANLIGVPGGIGTEQIADGAVTPNKFSKQLWWEEIGRAKITTSNNNIVVYIPHRKYIKVIISTISADETFMYLRVNNDNSAKYSNRISVNGATDTTEVSMNRMTLNSNAAIGRQFAEVDIVTLTSWAHMRGSLMQSTLYSNQPITTRREVASTFDNSSTLSITSIVVTGGPVGTNYAPGSEVIVLGHD